MGCEGNDFGVEGVFCDWDALACVCVMAVVDWRMLEQLESVERLKVIRDDEVFGCWREERA